MINWQLTYDDGSGEQLLNLSNGETSDIKEIAKIQFHVMINEENSTSYGEPIIVIGDIPVELEFSHLDGATKVFKSAKPNEVERQQLFYNYFGESETILSFSNHNEVYRSIINVLARPVNAEMAKSMLDYLSENVDDVVSLCFSRSKTGVDSLNGNSSNYLKLNLLKQAVEYLSANQNRFFREHRCKWVDHMSLSENGQPTGPNSIHWALSQLDQLSPARPEESNIRFNNRTYRFDRVPTESIRENTDVFENQVLHTFLAMGMDFLFRLKTDWLSTVSNNQLTNHDTDGYVRFDHTLSKFRTQILKYQIQEVDAIIEKISILKRAFSKKIPAKVVDSLMPKVTPYVQRHSHYHQVFSYIFQWFRAPSPSLLTKELLMGLRNLSSIYEITSLVMLTSILNSKFKMKMSFSKYRKHGQGISFGGIEAERPHGDMNNHFRFEGDSINADLYYEPRINKFEPSITKPGDIVDISNLSGGSYGPHHFCPDYVLRFTSPKWQKPLLIILDAKYTNSRNVKKYYLSKLMERYLLGIHQVKENFTLGVSPVQLLLILFAHDNSGSRLSNVSSRHSLSGSLPVLPQAGALVFKPGNQLLVEQFLSNAVKVFDNE